MSRRARQLNRDVAETPLWSDHKVDIYYLLYIYIFIHRSIHYTSPVLQHAHFIPMWVWEREAHISWAMVTCQGRTRSELP